MWQGFARVVLGESVGGRLPERVQRAISGQEAASEILVAWVQLVVVAIFATLYSLAPKTFSAETDFAPVPWALGLYFAFTVLRLAVVHRGAPPRWFLALSVIVDMALLMVLIWSFHLQYRQPPAFYLKAPTLLYAFIFIALRALRFDPWFVLLAGAAAAAGWLLLVLYAVTVDPADDMITRDYVRYLTSNRVLLGAEFDKVISIAMVTVILAVALVRARRLLVRSVSEEAAHSDLSRFFAPEIARQITGSECRIEPGQGEVREAAILNVDIRGFTALAMRMRPNDLMTLLAEYESRMVAVIQRHGGSVDKFMGDGIMATFGAAVVTETYAADAMRAVEDLVVEAERWRAERLAAGREPLDIRFAVTVGPVVFGAVGDETRLEYTVIGEPVNLAARLDKHTKVEHVKALTTAESLAVARRQGFTPAAGGCEERPGRVVAGVEAPLDLVVLAG